MVFVSDGRSEMSPADPKIQPLLERAIAAHRDGRLPEAETGYRAVLVHDPKNSDALHLLGMLASAAGQPQQAIDLVGRALRGKPTADMHNTLGIAYRALGRLDQALTQFLAACNMRPGLAVAWLNRGGTLLDLGLPEKAIPCFRRCLALAPETIDAQFGLGLALRRLQRDEEAVAAFRALVDRAPGHLAGWQQLGDGLLQLENYAEAETALARAQALDPNRAETFELLGHLALARGQPARAAAQFREALARDADLRDAHYHLGRALIYSADPEGAILALEEALACDSENLEIVADLSCAHLLLSPNLPTERGTQLLERLDGFLATRPDAARLHFFRGALLREMRRPADARAALLRALEIDRELVVARIELATVLIDCDEIDLALEHFRALPPRDESRVQQRGLYAIVEFNRGNALARLRYSDEAVAAYRAAIALYPDNPRAYNNLGGLLVQRGEVAEGIAAVRHACELGGDTATWHSNLILNLEFQPFADEAAQQAERRHWYARHGRSWAAGIAPHRNTPAPERRLRVGYVSGDFRNHVSVRVIAPVLLNHDPEQIEMVCYAASGHDDGFTEQFRRAAVRWRQIEHMSDEAVAQLIRDDRIDILVDLSGHSAGNRLPVFTRKPAPVQISAWGLPRGTGIESMDYLFSDPVLIPPESAASLVETVVYLPCWMPYSPLDDRCDLAPPPCLRTGRMTFGSFNRLAKASDEALAAWGRILRAMPESRLLLCDDHGLPERNPVLRQRMGAAGMPLDRVEIRANQERQAYLQAYSEIDLSLDPFPQSGGVTTFEGLWMGVPTMALLGNSSSARGSAAILHALGLADFVVDSPQAYVERALAKAADPAGLAALRPALRDRLAMSPVGDISTYVRAVEAAYRAAWRSWCAAQR